ncbi:hypothetical protein RND81_11G094400 [Saponaria officinalis]|uniref:Protein ENHANCED DISEASE RESISTANCE 2-like n=1 Tax=Saponaria officinalis TaxID=3572 RepID=A0AAW1HJZ2_SAPOF
MDIFQSGAKMEGWLYVIRSNRFGLQNARKRFFVLKDHHLNCFKSIPCSKNEDPVKRTALESYIRVSDNGRENIHRKVFFVFTLYNTSNHNDRLKIGARSSEEAARWIHSFQEVISPASGNNGVVCTRSAWQSRFFSSKRVHHCESMDWASGSFNQGDPNTSDVIAPSPWTIFGCQNGLRLFKERKDKDSHGKLWDDHPAIMAVGVMDGASEAIFRTVMSLGPSRSEWDFSFYQGNVVEHLDGHTDIIHKQLYSYWLPRRMRRRDLLLRRYWRRDGDGTYVILYHSVYHKKCPQQKGYTRACLKSGGYVITPVNYGKQSVVKHMLAIDWKYWKAYLLPSSSRSITISMLGRVAALREYVKANAVEYASNFSNGDLAFSNGAEKEKPEEKESSKVLSEHGRLVELNDIGEEFFDVPELSCDLPDDGWPSDCGSETYLQLQETQHKSSTGSTLVKKLHEFSAHKKGYVDLVETTEEDALSWCYGCTLKKDPSCSVLSSCATTDPSTFLIRGKSYLRDRKKIKANKALMQMIGADWLKSDKREDDLGGRSGSIVQDYAKKGGPEFFFIVNIQVPGSTTYNLALYYMINSLQDSTLLQKFVEGNDAYRNSRFKLIPYISKGSWIVKQSVGKKACLAGQALEINYIRGNNYIELDVDVGSSTVARGVVNLVLGYLSNLVIEMAFLLEANTEDELPEQLLGTCRLNHLDASKAMSVTEL